MNIKDIQLEIIEAEVSIPDVDIKMTEHKNCDQETIRGTIAFSLRDAQHNKYESISFSDLGCRNLDFPLTGMAKIMVQEIMNYTRMCKNPSLKKIMFYVEEGEALKVFDKTMRGYIQHIQDELGPGPYVTVDIIIEMDEGIILIERSNPPYGWALPGGFLDYGESLEQAAMREAKEETNMDLEDLRQFHTYSKPGRDPRFQTISTVFIAKGKGTPQSGDDAQNLKIIPYEDVLKFDYAFDHKDIIKEYREK